jgi:excisionase family DNA binding protein
MNDHLETDDRTDLVSAREAARRLDCTVQTVRRYVKAGDLKAFRIRRRLFFRPADLIALFHLQGNK